MNAKSILGGCVGSLIAIAGAQAADLPVKAQPIQYVKICSLYGVGFYYIPGTDMCIKVGGYVRSQAEWGSSNGIPAGTNSIPLTGPNTIVNGLFNRASNNFNFSGRAMISVDARNESEYGTIRAYLRIGAQTFSNSETSSFVADRAFIQFAGFTAGRAVSFFDIFTTTEAFSYSDSRTSGDTYNYGQFLFAYTAGLGNGVSATISAEAPRRVGVIDGAGGGFSVNGVTITDTAGFDMPDIVGNLRIDQNWGYLGVSGAVHKVAGGYYNGTLSPIQAHPDDRFGWAAGVGGLINLPWGDTIGASFVGTRGAVGYATKAGNWQIVNGSTAGVGWVADGIFDNILNGGPNQLPIQLTNAWSANAGYEHFWNTRWRTSLYGGYTRVWYDQTAKDIAAEHLPTPPTAPGVACGQPVEGAVWPPIAVNHGEGNSCSPNFSFWQVGSRTQWNVTKDFYMGVDVTYTHLNTAYKGVAVSPVTNIYFGNTAMDDQHVLSGIFRMQYNFAAGLEGPNVMFGR